MSTGTRVDEIEAALAPQVESGKVPGLVWLIADDDGVHTGTMGVQALGAGPMQRDTIFRIASMTKPVTATAAMLLVQDHTIGLDDAVDRWLPELADPKVLKRIDAPLDDNEPAERAITVRDLLTFRMGSGLVFADPEQVPILKAMDDASLGVGPPKPGEQPGPDEWIARFASLPLMYQPGEKWQYHTASEVLGVLIARASGQTLEAFFADRIFGPLGMNDTGFVVPAPKMDRFATSYRTDPESDVLEVSDEPATGGWSRPPAFPSAGGGLASTADDYLAFARALLGGGAPLLEASSVEAMTTDHLSDAQKDDDARMIIDDRGWGFCMAVGERGTYGWDGGLGTSWLNDPAAATTSILLTQAEWNSAAGPEIHHRFRALAHPDGT